MPACLRSVAAVAASRVADSLRAADIPAHLQACFRPNPHGRQNASRSGAGDAEAAGFRVVAAEISPQQLRSALTYPPAFGPTEWGPIPYLPDPDLLVQVTMPGRFAPLICEACQQTESVPAYVQFVIECSTASCCTQAHCRSCRLAPGAFFEVTL